MFHVTDLLVKGTRCAIYQAGDLRSAEAVVFIHGNPGPMEDWEEIAPSIAEIARVVAIDMPGFGRAEHPKRFDFSIEGYAGYLGAALDELGIERVHLVAHDFGAAWAVRWAVDHPNALASIVLINGLPLTSDFEWHFFAKLWQTPVIGELLHMCSGRASIGYVMNRDNPRPLPDAFISRVMRYYDWNQGIAVNELYRATRDVAANLAPLGASLRALDPPACVIWGADDRYVPVCHAKTMHRLFSQAELHLLDGCGHWPFIDEPTRVLDIVSSFLSRQFIEAGELKGRGDEAPLDFHKAAVGSRKSIS